MKKTNTATIFDIQRASYADGPGIRTTVFFKGCNLRCAWCHNPESQNFEAQMLFYQSKCTECGKCKEKCPNHLNSCDLCGACTFYCPQDARELCGRKYTADEVLAEILKDRSLYENTGGGVTFSGGECMLQIDFLEEILKECKQKGIHTAVDTAGHLPWGSFEKILPYTDLFLYDVKSMDKETHRRYVGVDNGLILENLAKLLRSGANVWVRMPVVAGVNDHPDEMNKMKQFFEQNGYPQKIELLPYHPMGEHKYAALGRTAETFTAPNAETIRKLKSIILTEREEKSVTEYILGANYWASNAGAEMWRDFDASCIEKDLKALCENGIEYVRVFPNWRDFQPAVALYGANNCFCEYRMGNAELPKNPYYLDETMLDRFDQFCSLCEMIGIKVIPSLLTGWMSGRMFLPPALEGKNLFSDAEALNFEQKFIEGFIKRFRDKSVIVAWDVGNECSCLTYADNHDRAEFWTAFISNTIRSADNTRPIISGIHDMKPQGRWRIQDQGKYCDILVAHPYPYWGRHTGNDRITSIRTLLHATAIHNLYRDIGGKPCFVNEIGTMGPMVCDDEVSAGFAKANLYACLAHGSVGFMWWCAHEQTNLTTAPYSWNMCETELGLLDAEGKPKPVLREIKAFADWRKSCDLKLSAPQVDAICILTRDQDQWGVAYMTYILAVMAGLNIGFCYGDDPLPKADTYLMPSVTGHWVMPGERYAELRERVRQGATLYISNSNSILSEFNQLAGVRVVDSAQVSERSEMLLDGERITFSRSKKYDIVPKDEKNVIAYETNGDPVLVRNGYGDGQVLYLNFPLEEMLLHGSERFAENHHLVYKTLFKDLIAQHCVTSDVAHLGITHHFDEEDATVVIINYSPNTCHPRFHVREGYEIRRIIKGNMDVMESFSTTILQVTKK